MVFYFGVVMKLIFLDFESYWSSTWDIKKAGGPIRYVMNKKTEIQSCAVKIGKGETVVYFGDEIKEAFDDIDWSDAMAIGHNMSGFDSMILAWRYGVNPKAWGCTMAMARPVYAKTVGVSLRKVAEALDVGVKLSLEATNTKGKYLADFSPEEIEGMREYNKVDTDLCALIFEKLYPLIGNKELKTIDATIRMLTEPKFVVDKELLTDTLVAVDIEKMEVLNNIADNFEIFGEDRTDQVKKLLASAPKFSKILTDLGIPVPMKVSPRTGKECPALAKTDQGMLDLLDHEDEQVQALASARMDVKSTILQTRMQSFLNNSIGGRLPMPLHYAGADTTGRWSGFLFNPQNLPRINPSKPKHSDALRKSLGVPKGKIVIVADQSGIELRVNHYLWKVESSMDLYAQDALADLYKAFAAEMYNIPMEEVDKSKRQLAKIAQLGLGYGAGAKTFERIAKMMGGIELTPEEAKEVVDKWRKAYKNIVQGWKKFDVCIPYMESGDYQPIDPWGFCTTEKHSVRLPSGRLIRYPHLRQIDSEGRKQYYYGEGRHKSSLYAGKGVENLVQAISRDIINDNMLEFKKVTGINPSLLVHDEIVCVVDEKNADDILATLQGIMRTSPSWWPDLVLWSEGDKAYTYGDAK